ncbi:MAG TPA: nucleotidyl transferase AbiEii/AbiGii toxin family protein [Myxococcales bacterium]|nr:nucleotidyl transferase AbiEii/AbiGii toxin family protein [Myxococcales bacterium]
MFEREHHRYVATVLESLDAALLASKGCLFGGATAIVLRYGEYRESLDIDFLVSSQQGYRDLRQLVTGSRGLNALARTGCKLEETRELRADQYGLRTRVRVLDAEIKFEIVFEVRISLDVPGPEDRICGIAALNPIDMAATKLLANSDRWRDDAVHSRDIIDLAMMAPPSKLLLGAKEKARGAYGDSIDKDLKAAVDRFAGHPEKLDDCMRALQMHVPRALLWNRMRPLSRVRRRSV